MKPRELLPIIERVRRGTSNRDVVTICDALHDRVIKEMADQTVKTIEDACEDIRDTTKAVRAAADRAAVSPDKDLRPTTAMAAVVARAEPDRKPAKGKAKRALARKAKLKQ